MASPVNEKTERSIKSVAVVGAGVSGLAAAYKLKSHGLEVTLFEAEGRTGGKIRSMSQNGFVWDEGANTMTETEFEVGRLINNLGLREKQQSPISQNKRYIVKNGRPELIPPNPIALIKGNFLSLQSKFRIIFEPFLWRSSGIRSGPSKISPEYSQESVGEFFCRHFGKEVVDYLIDPFVAGTSGGDPESLSMRHAFPEIWQLEKNFGSIILGSIRSKFSQNKASETRTSLEKRDKKILHGSFSFVGGMQTLTDALSKEIGLDNIQLNSKVRSLSYNHDEDPLSRDWFVSYDTNTATNNGSTLERSFDAVVMTAPLSNVKEMKITRNGNPFILDFLPVVNYLPLSILVTAFRKEDVKRPLEGFGVLVPSKEQENGLKTLGTLFSSMMFPDRAAGDCYLYTTFIGGSRNRDLASASLDQLKAIVTSDLRKLLGVEGQPTFLKHIYWSDAFPLYSRDYDLVLKAIERLENGFPGLFYAGNHRDGLSVGKAISSGCKAADLVVSYLK